MAKFTEPGKWDLVVSCAGCGKPFPFAETVSPEEKSDFQYQTISDLPCPQCGHVDTYAPALMSRQPGPEK
jgi:DNA-directed RNA polymerase subunit RPC12/RpoP